jgi:fimbrial isopeptide formation D2 family protein
VTRSSSCVRRPFFSQILSKTQFAITVLLLLAVSGLQSHLFALQQLVVRGPKIWLGDNQALPVQPVGPTTLAQYVAAGKAQPLSMTAADVDGDGVTDMIAGFSAPGGGSLVIHRGNVDAFAPQSTASFQAIGRGQFPSPFLPNAQVIDIPLRPDFVAVGNFTASGHQDLIVASRGGNTLLVFAGDGKGNFGAPQTVALNGSITALGAEHLVAGSAFSNLVVGTATPQDAALLVFSGSMQGLGSPVTLTQRAAVSAIAFGDFGEANTDTAFLAGGDVFVLHTSSLQVEALNLPVSASAIALGSFIYDRNPHTQLALLASDGSVHIAAHSEFDPHTLSLDEMKTIRQAIRNGEANPLVPERGVAVNGWKIVESIPAAAPFNAGQMPQFFRTRISDQGSDDLMVLNSSLSQMSVISHPDVPPDTATFQPAQISTRPYAGSPNAALSMRTNIDGRPGVVAMHAGQLAPAVMMPLPDPTFFVNRTDDPTPTAPITNACNNVSNVDVSSSCSVREAVLRANATAGTDTIQIAAGTYTLTLAKVTGDFTGNHGALYINDSVNIVGAGQNTTIIQAGASNAAGVDMVMAVNEDISPITNATASISNLTLKFGHNRGTHGNDGDGGCMEYDTGSSGNANLTLTNVTLSDCTTSLGNGAGIAIFNFVLPNNGLATFTNSIIQNSSAVDTTAGVGAGGGGIWVSQDSRASLTNTQLLNNSATEVNTGLGIGGGIFLFTNTPNSRQTVIHGGAISGNKSAGFGGGVYNLVNLLIDTGTVISGNTAGTNGSTPIAGQDGGGLYLNTSANGCPAACTDTTSLTKITITGNTASGNGGGIAVGNGTGAGSVTMTFSRVAGNTATVGSTNLDNNHTTVSATNDWWGTNTPTNTIHDTATTTTSTPFIKMTHVASPATIRINQSTTLTADLSKDNNGNGAALAGNLDVLNAVPILFNNAIKGTLTGAGTALSAGAQATATFNAGAISGNGSADATVDQQTVTAPIVILEPLQITKSFVPAAVAVNAASALTFSVTNPNVIAVDASFTDTLPAGLVVATPPTITNTCGGTVTAVAGSGSVSFSNASLPVGACTISVHVSSATDNVYSNSVTIDSTAAGTGPQSTSSASLTVINPPSIQKVFGATTIPLNGTTSLTFTIQSSNVNLTLNGIAFTDSLPAGLIVATPSGLSSTCGGTATAVAGSSSISLSGGTLAPQASCTVSVNVQGTTTGAKINSVTVSDAVAGTGNTSTATITVIAPPLIIKAFGAASIPLNGSTSLSFTIQNNNTTVSLSGVGFSDTLPAGLVISTPNGLTGSCGGGTITATAGGSVISLSGASLAASTSCTFAVNVTGIAAGLQNNTTGNVTSTEGGTGGTASASINVVAPPSIAKVFNPSAIALNATTSLTFTITNPAANAVALTGVAFTDTLPTGLTVANASATVCGGTLTTTAPTGIALSGATIAVNSQCQFSVTVTGAAAGVFVNTTGTVTSTNGGTGNAATATLSVATPPTITKSFGAAAIAVGGSTSLSFTINNPNTTTSLTGVAFTDNLPAGLVVSTPNGLTGSCGGGTITAVPGAASVSLAGATLATTASCTLSVNVTGTTGGVKSNSVQVTATESGPGNTSNASITVTSPPVIIKAFGAASIPLNGSTSLQFTIQNNNTTTSLNGVAFSDTLPAGLVVSTPNGLTGSCGGGTITAVAGSGNVSLSGATLAASTSCTFSINVTGTTAGSKNNTTGNVTSTEGGTGGTASASIAVVAPPSIAKAFNPTAIGVNGTSTLTFTMTNPAANTVAEVGVAFTDTLPAGLVVATPNGLTNTCGGTATATAGSGSISLSGGTIAAASSCTLSANVTGASTGTFNNTSGAVSSTNGGTGNTASATLTIAPADMTITKTHVGTFHRGQTGAQYTITVSNSGAGPTVGTVTVVDTLPNVQNTIVPTALSGTGWTCTLGTLTCTRSDVLAPGGSYPPITLTVNIPINIQNNFTNTATVSGGGETNTGNNTASDPVSLGPPIIITPHSNSSSVKAGTAATFVFDVEDDDSTLGMVAFGCSGLPVGTACVFNPPATNQPLSTVTMTLTTSSNASNVFSSQRFDGPNPRLYAALAFPALGLVAIVFSGRRSRKTKLRLTFAFAGMVMLLALAGCGGAHGVSTPTGNFSITVTGATTTVQATTQVTLTVQ